MTLAFRAHKIPDGLSSVVVYRRTRRRKKNGSSSRGVVSCSSLGGRERERKVAYQTTGVIVVQLDQSLDVAAFSIRSVHEVSRLLEAEFHVVAATSPLPVTLGRQTLLHFDGAAQFAKLITCAICVIREKKIKKLSLHEMIGE